MSPQTIALIFGGLALLLMVYGLISMRSSRGVEQRLERFTDAEWKREDIERESGKRATPVADTLNRAIAGRGFASNLSTQLARADMKVTVAEYLVLWVLAVIAGGVLGWFLSPGSIFFIITAVVGFFAPRIIMGRAQASRLKAFNNQLSDMLNLMVNGLRSGYSVTQAMEAVAAELPVPVSTEIGRVVREMQLGLSMEQALGNMLRRVPSDDLDLVVTAMNVQREVGGNLAEILDTISHTIRERVRIKGEVAVLTAQGRISMYVITFLPIGISLFLYLVNRQYITTFFNSGPCGWIMVVCAMLSVTAGYFTIRKIVTIEV
jgi:tight adherence protein B